MTKVLTVEDFEQVAADNGWGEVWHSDTVEFLSPRSGIYEPKKLVLRFDDWSVTPGLSAQVFTDIDAGRGIRPYSITGSGAFSIIANTAHPLRASEFFKLTSQVHKQIVETHDLGLSTIRTPALKGFFRFFKADELAVKVLGLLPMEVWGADAWVEATEGAWA